MRRQVLVVLILLSTCAPAAADMATFRDPERHIAFSYNDKLWHKSDQTNPKLLIRIERRLLDGKAISMCQLGAKKTAYATAIEGHVHEERERIASQLTDSSRQPDLEVVSSRSRALTLDQQPVIEVRHLVKERSVNFPFGATFLLRYTVRAGEEIMLQCARVGPFERPPDKEGFLESEMRAVLETLRFDE